MINVLKKILGQPALAPAPGKRPASSSSERPSHAYKYPAVTVIPSLMCCRAATKAMDKRVLFSEAPRLPLSDCTMPNECSCKYLKKADRRDGDRRLFNSMETNRWFPGTERRTVANRRARTTA